jgi:hypothetical protein
MCLGVLGFAPKKQVQKMKKFSVWLFHLALGKCFTLPSTVKENGDGPKHYYILPMLPEENNALSIAATTTTTTTTDVIIDWSAVDMALTSSLVYRQKVVFFGGFSELMKANFHDDNSNESMMDGKLRMRNGIFGVEEFKDAVVTCANNGVPCYVAGIAFHRSSNSFVKSHSSKTSPMTYTQYYMEK